jgi:hypothetical protein
MQEKCVKGRSLLLAVAGLALAATPSFAQRGGAPKLGVDGLVLFRDQGSVAVLAIATPYWQPVSTRSEELLGDFRYLPDFASARAQGQLFELVDSDAPGLVADEEGRFVVVPWSFGPGCAEEGWDGPQWVAPGDTVAFLLHPTRAGTQGREGLRVFDVLGWHQPYPVGELIPFWRRGRKVNPQWLDAREFYQLLTVLPTELAFQDDHLGAMAPFQEWVAEKEGRATAFPVPEIQGGWAKALGEVADQGTAGTHQNPSMGDPR